jgi:hypothetical protein
MSGPFLLRQTLYINIDIEILTNLNLSCYPIEIYRCFPQSFQINVGIMP